MIPKFEKYLGQYFDKVINELSNKEYILETEEVKPYEDMEPKEKKRIINIKKINDNKLKIIWSHENYN